MAADKEDYIAHCIIVHIVLDILRQCDKIFW